MAHRSKGEGRLGGFLLVAQDLQLAGCSAGPSGPAARSYMEDLQACVLPIGHAPAEGPLHQLFLPIHKRSRMWVMSGRCNQSGPDRVFQHVPHDLPGTLGIPQYVVVETGLPQPLPGPLLPNERRHLLENSDELEQIAVVPFSFDHQMEMIRHLAVRNYSKPEICRCSPKLQQDDLPGGRIAQQPPSPIATNRDGVALIAAVERVVETWWMPIRHVSAMGNGDAMTGAGPEGPVLHCVLAVRSPSIARRETEHHRSDAERRAANRREGEGRSGGSL